MPTPRVIDLRSDTVTQPSPEMWEAMRAAPLGDDVLGDDPTVTRLEEAVAARLGKERALFVPSGTMANQLAIRTACQAGDEIVAHRDSHIIHYETGAPAALSGCMILPLEGPGGLFQAPQLLAAIRPDNVHAPRTRMVVVENTHNRGGGTIWPLRAFQAVSGAARERALHVHVDGARLWNAAVAGGYSPAEFAAAADTVSVCFSKALGCPAGSALAGPAPFIARARRFRKMFGGGMRQSGLLAAAALHALEHHVAPLARDHEHARRLAAGLAAIPGIRLQVPPQETPSNMVFFFLEPRFGGAAAFCESLGAKGVRMIDMDPDRVRAVTHRDVDAAAIDAALAAVRSLA